MINQCSSIISSNDYYLDSNRTGRTGLDILGLISELNGRQVNVNQSRIIENMQTVMMKLELKRATTTKKEMVGEPGQGYCRYRD